MLGLFSRRSCAVRSPSCLFRHRGGPVERTRGCSAWRAPAQNSIHWGIPVSWGKESPLQCQRQWLSCGLLPLQDNKKMKKSLEEEQRARKDLEKLVRRVLKNMNDPAWDETNLWGMALVPSEDQLQDQAWSPAIQAGVTCGITGQGRMKGILLSVHRKAGDYLENRNGHTAPKESKREVQTPRAGPR